MASFRKLSLISALFHTLIILLIIPVTSQPQPQPQACESFRFPNTTIFLACNDLPVLDSSLHWTYHSSSNSIDVAFKKNNANHKRWIAWAINPTSTGMVGSQAFVAFQKSDGTMAAYTSPITSYGTTLEEGSLSFEVHEVSASFEDGTMILYASFQLPGNPKLVNHVWQEGLVSDDDSCLSHALSGDNFKSFGRVDFLTGKVSDRDPHKQNSKILLRKVHGILNGIGWGILMPTGAIMGRYLKRLEATGSTWFRLHRACQILAYIIGTIGFALGIFLSGPSLSSLSPYAFVHASIGIAVFVSATVQVLAAIFLRPDKHHRARIFWNIFHYVVGYGVIFLSVFNMFRGFSLSNPYHSWKNAYFGVIVSLGCVALILEAITWFFFCKRRNKKEMNLEETSANDNIPPQQIV
ncbi:hypothetical protein QN277_024923 [Acacia crassicarpa]|uniref:Cytochrome b561 and DOMON domain-containing protein n=1 Tax=Acacia crassicarpa TaxID=499986 RepID=A0AAE1MK26_9FABA|nr:hypothetical protein QN277_024923 [Acacia crassicarpa]